MIFSGCLDVPVLATADMPYATFYKLEDQIVILVYNDMEVEITQDDAEMHSTLLRGLCGGEKCKMILDFQKSPATFTNEAREYAAKDSRHLSVVASQALVLSTLAHKIVANFYMRVNKPSFPIKSFRSMKEAYKWTLSLKQSMEPIVE